MFDMQGGGMGLAVKEGRELRTMLEQLAVCFAEE